MSGSSAQTIQSYDQNHDGKYENEMDCHWFIMGDAGKVLKLTFTTFNYDLWYFKFNSININL